MIFDELSKLMNAIETRLWQGPKLLAGLLYLAVLAFAAECLKMIGRFVDSFVSAVTRKPATWHIVTLGELIEIAVTDQRRGFKLGHDLAVSDHGAAGGDTAVDGHHGAGDVAGLGRGQERDEIGYFL